MGFSCNRNLIVVAPAHPSKQRLFRELALFLGLVFVGLVLLPVAIYLVGGAVFGEYGGQGFSDFFSTMIGRVRNGETVAWFLILSPYLGWQVLRLTAMAWRLAARENG